MHLLATSSSPIFHAETAFSHSILFAQPLNWLGRTCKTNTSKRPRPPPRTLPIRAKYTPSEDDRAEQTSDVPTQLTLAQQLLMKQYQEQIDRMGTEECQKLCIEIARQMMVKDNILRKMLKGDVNFGIEPPDPDDFQTEEQAGK